MDRALLINQLSLAQKLSDSYTTGVRFKMEQSKVTLTAKNIDYGDDYHGEIEADLIGKDREIHISANKTLEILKRCEEEFITLKYYTNKPFIIISEKNFDCMTSFVQKFD
jgi:DNA polymerase III sliding clamp (beta) subunit (PCNA family)